MSDEWDETWGEEAQRLLDAATSQNGACPQPWRVVEWSVLDVGGFPVSECVQPEVGALIAAAPTLAARVVTLEAVALRFYKALHQLASETDQWGSHPHGPLHAIARTAVDPPLNDPASPSEVELIEALRGAK